MSTLQERLEPVAARLAVVQEQAKALAALEAELKAEVRAIVAEEPGKYGAGSLVVNVQINRRFSEKRALAALPEALVPQVTYPETRIDRDRLKVLAPEIFESSWDIGEPRVGLA